MHLMMGQGDGPLQKMPRLQAFSPASLLDRSEQLGLTVGQMKELDEIVAHLNEVMEEATASMMNMRTR